MPVIRLYHLSAGGVTLSDREAGWLVQQAKLDEKSSRTSRETIFTLANGYMGLRGSHEEGLLSEEPGFYVAGVFDRAPTEDEVPRLVSLPNWIGIDLIIDGVLIGLDSVGIVGYDRSLDMRAGMLSRRVKIADASGRLTQIHARRFLSIDQPHLGVLTYEVTPINYVGAITIRSMIETGVSNCGEKHIGSYTVLGREHDSISMAVQTLQSKIRVAYAMGCQAYQGGQAISGARYIEDGSRIGLQYDFTEVGLCGCGLTKMVTVFTSRDVDDPSCPTCRAEPEADAQNAIQEMLNSNTADIFLRHEKSWHDRWECCDIEINGPLFDQQAVRFAIFHSLQVANPYDDTVGLAAKGLHGEGYMGHVFWDMDIFNLPLFTFCFPEVARNLITYRYRTLPGARKKAAERGFLGAMYAWESAETGEEATPKWTAPDPVSGERSRILCGETEQHASADVAYAIWQYYQVTGDIELLLSRGAEIIIDTARFWSSRATWNEAKNAYEITEVMGPDEYHEVIDNNVYTNVMAHWNMIKALEIVDNLQAKHPMAWKQIESNLDWTCEDLQRITRVSHAMYKGNLTSNEELIEQFDHFYDLDDVYDRLMTKDEAALRKAVNDRDINRLQVLKQPDVLMLAFLLPEMFSNDRLMVNWSYYEPRTLHDSSLSSSVHAIISSRLGLPVQAYAYFLRSAQTDLSVTMDNSPDGIHLASLGGIWQAVAMGFTGILCTDGKLAVDPWLPVNWESYSLRFCYQGKRMRVLVSKQGTELELVDTGDGTEQLVMTIRSKCARF